MKKIITAAVASAFAFLAMGAGVLPSGTSLEDLTAGVALDPTKDDSGTGSDSVFWLLTGDENADLLVTNYVAASYEPRPEQFSGANNNFLKIDTTGRLYRSISANDGNVEYFDTVTIGDGIYLDTLVQFTAADKAFEAGDIAEGDKIAISYVERDADSVEDGETPYTNFVVRAAYVDAANSKIVATNYYLTFPGQAANAVQFDKTAWHRLTVRAISNVTKDENANAPVGFIVYIDGTNLVYDASVAAGDAAYVGSLNSVVQTYLYNDEKHALLPSLLSSADDDYDTLSAVAFNGNGCVDDISFTATKPGILPSEGMTVTIAWDDNVASYTVVAGKTPLVDGEVVSGEGSTNLLLSAGITAITVTATYAEGYEAGVWSKSAGTLNNGVWTFENGATLTIKSMEPLFDVGGVHYGSFEDALAAATAGGAYATIKLLADYTGDIAFDTENTASIIIDLAGKTLTGDSDAAIHTGCADIIITNSTVEVGHVVAPEGGVAVVLEADAVLAVYAGIFDGEIADDSGETAVLTIYGGSFYDAAHVDDPTNDFYLKSFVAEGSTISEPVSGYFTVSGAEPPAPTPTSVEVPTAVENLVYDGTEKIGVIAGTGYTLTGNIATNAGNYTATATLEDGYVWSDTTTAPKSIDWSIAVNSGATVDLALASEIAEWTDVLDFPAVTAKVGTEDVTGEPVWDPAKISEPDAGTTNTYTVTFTVMNGGYTGSTGTAEFKVYKSAGGGSNWPAGWNSGNEPASMVTAFNTWIAAGNDPTAANAEAAFLVGVNVADYKNDFAAASISIVGGKIVITGNYNLSTVNGALSVKMGDAPNALGAPTAVTATEGAISLTPALGETKKFYKLVIGYPAN
jgi:hypothetical protein